MLHSCPWIDTCCAHHDKHTKASSTILSVTDNQTGRWSLKASVECTTQWHSVICTTEVSLKSHKLNAALLVSSLLC